LRGTATCSQAGTRKRFGEKSLRWSSILQEKVEELLRPSFGEDEDHALALDYGQGSVAEMIEVGEADPINPGGMPPPPGPPNQASDVEQEAIGHQT